MDSNYRRGPLADDEPVILLDRKDREYLSRLDQRRPIAIRGGKIAVEDIIGHDEGIVVRSSLNEPDSQSAAHGASRLSKRPRPDLDLG